MSALEDRLRSLIISHHTDRVVGTHFQIESARHWRIFVEIVGAVQYQNVALTSRGLGPAAPEALSEILVAPIIQRRCRGMVLRMVVNSLAKRSVLVFYIALSI